MRSLFRNCVCLLTAALVLLLAGTAQAATFTVTTTTDATDLVVGDTQCTSTAPGCTLRAAVQEANSGVGADTIVVPAGTYTLTLSGTEASDTGNDAIGDLDLLNDVTINGDSNGATIVQAGTSDTNGIDRVFEARGSLTDAFINVLTIRHGKAVDATGKDLGGGVRNDDGATLTIKRVTINDNSAPGTGGGIFNGATLSVENSTISGNDASVGGGVGSSGSSPSTTLLNVTIANNTADGSGIDGGGIAHVTGPAPSLKNTILADNTPNNCGTSPTSQGHNLDSGTSCNLGGTGDLSSANAALGSLQDNGGPTFTHALGANSDAIDAGDDNGAPNIDQRGVSRPKDGDVDGTAVTDIGAYEAEREADLAIAKTDSPDPVRADDQLTYTLSVTNNGPDRATNVEVTDTLPANVTFVSASPGCTETLGTVTCDLGNIDSGAPAAQVQIVVTPTRVGEISNTATVSSDIPDPDEGQVGSDNSDTETTTVEMSLNEIPSPTSDTTPTYSGKASPTGGTVTVTVKDDQDQVVQTRTATPDPTTGAYSVDGFPALVDGDYTAQASQGTGPSTTTSQVRSFTIDTAGPEVTLDPVPSPSNDTTPTFSGTADPNNGDVTVTVKDDQDQVVQTRTATPDGNGDYSVDASPPLADGDYTAQASQTDEAGNTSTSQVRSFTIDTEETTSPDSVQANKGKVVSGNASSLNNDDNNFFAVKAKSGSKKVVWSANFNGVPNDLSDFELVYKGMNSKSCTQKLKVFNFTTGSFETVDTRQVGPSEQEITVDDGNLTGDPEDYVSGTSGNGTFQVKVVCSGATKNTSSGDLMELTFQTST